MRTLSDADVLGLWESGSHRHPLDQALLTLAAAFPEMHYEALANWPIGQRNRCLADLYCTWFGPRLRAWTPCVHCGEKLEFAMEGRVLAGEGIAGRGCEDERVTANGFTFRLPTSRDLALAAGAGGPADGAVRIAESCLIGANPPAEWSEEDLAVIGEKLASADPFAEVRVTLRCPGCGTNWEESLDLVSFVWAEIDGRARRVLFGIHTLASAFGWSEADILLLSEKRRSVYLEMAQS